MLGDTSPVSRLGGRRPEDNLPAAITDIGCEREINEDRYAVVDSAAGRAWVVCDGMGGALGGELAAQLAIDAVRRALESREFDSTIEALKFAVEEANRIIVLRRQNPAFSGMGTTVVGAMVQGDEVIIAHAGDSRAYLIRNGAIQQLTVDHTYVQDLVDRGAINPEEALSHPQAHVLTRCLGAEPRLEIELQTYWIWPSDNADEIDDRLLLCSDGLYSMVSDEEIADHVSKYSPQEACAQLVELARSRGGYDNITLAILPLGGQLREESPEEPRVQRRKKNKTASTKAKSSLPVGKKLLLIFFLLLLGSVITLLLLLANSLGSQ